MLPRTLELLKPWSRYLFFLLPFLYTILYGRYGFSNTDDGTFFGHAWRISNGALPYKDFLLHAPPLSPYLHSLSQLFLPEHVQVIFERFFMYASIAAYSLLAAFVLKKFFDLASLKLNPYLLAAIGFVFSTHNFPAMPWYTVDGILFSVLGIYTLSKSEGNRAIFFGILFLFLAGLTKQSFYLMPCIGIALVYLLYGKTKLFSSILYLILFFVVFLFYLTWSGSANEFLEQTTSVTSLPALIATGFFAYAATPALPIALILFGFLLLQHTGAHRILQQWTGWTLVFLFFLALTLNVVVATKQQMFISPQFWYPQTLLVLGLLVIGKDIIYRQMVLPILLASLFIVFGIFTMYAQPLIHPKFTYLHTILLLALIAATKTMFLKDKKTIIFLVLLVISWSASISSGYLTPILFATPLLFGFFYALRAYLNFSQMKLIALLTLFGGLTTFFLLYQYPYRDSPKKELKYDMGQVFPKLSFIRSDQETYEKYQELKSLHRAYGDNFTMLPLGVAANFLTNTQNPFPADWAASFELYHGQQMIERIRYSQAYVFVDRAMALERASESLVTGYIQEAWEEIERRRHFSVYQNPRAK